MIVTRRARTLLFLAFVCTAVGLVEYHSFLVQLGVATILWMGSEWWVFQFRANTLTRRITAVRHVADRTGRARVLWNGRPIQVQIQLDIRPSLRWLPASAVTIEDLLPHGTRCPENTPTRLEFAVRGAQQQAIEYVMQPESVGAVGFSGLRCILEDQHGFFLAERFIPLQQTLRVLPASHKLDTAATIRKPRNAMPPPGIHSILKAGAGSELLEIRDYVAGDPPKSVAWKVSARRDALMTKQFETEVPIRCQIFVDMARGTRLGYPGPCLAGRMIELAASVSNLLISHRDAVGMSVFDGHRIHITRPSANRRAQLQMVNMLATCMDEPLAPVATSLDRILPAALDVAHMRYPDAMYYALRARRGRFFPQRTQRRFRQCLAAIVVAHYSLDERALGELAENDHEMSYWLQRFLSDHRVPYVGERFDQHGVYLFDDRAKILQLARMLTHASAHSRDSELFLVCAELCDVQYDLGPLMHAIKLVVARGHRVAVLCAWPSDMPRTNDPVSLESLILEPDSHGDARLERRQRINTFHRIRSELARLRVPVALASEDQAIPLVAVQLEIVRSRRTAV